MRTLTDGSVELHAGRVLGRYELLVPIAAGGMAQVWAARLRGARQFQKIVAIKTMLPKLSEDAQFEQMFLDEASLASQVRHPNAVETLDLGEEDGVLYLVMEWIEGVPLNQLMKTAKASGGVPPAIAARIAMHTCAGLHAAHELRDDKGQLVGLVHRDVSPQNLLVTFDGVTKVVDFGVAKATALGGGATTAGQVKGKISYMAPEQVLGEGLDRRADVFALGIVLYALTTGKHPFRRESEAATMYHICSGERVLAPSRVLASYPPELEPIVLKALEKDRNNRYASCDEMLRALDGLPGHLRVGSDADVGSYLRSLFGDLRAEQRRRVEEAIVRADTASDPGLWPVPDPVSQVTGRESMGSLTATNETADWLSRSKRNAVRNRIIGGLGLIVLVLTSVVFFQATNQAPLAAAPPVEVGRQTNQPEARVAPAPAPVVVAPSSSPKAPQAKPTPTAPAAAPTSNANAKAARPRALQPKPKSTPKSGEAWKFEAGF